MCTFKCVTGSAWPYPKRILLRMTTSPWLLWFALVCNIIFGSVSSMGAYPCRVVQRYFTLNKCILPTLVVRNTLFRVK